MPSRRMQVNKIPRSRRVLKPRTHPLGRRMLLQRRLRHLPHQRSPASVRARSVLRLVRTKIARTSWISRTNRRAASAFLPIGIAGAPSRRPFFGRVTTATAVDYIVPHRGDPTNLQSLCTPHHSPNKREARGRIIGADGWLADSQLHRRRQRRRERMAQAEDAPMSQLVAVVQRLHCVATRSTGSKFCTQLEWRRSIAARRSFRGVLKRRCSRSATNPSRA